MNYEADGTKVTLEFNEDGWVETKVKDNDEFVKITVEIMVCKKDDKKFLTDEVVKAARAWLADEFGDIPRAPIPLGLYEALKALDNS